MADQDKCFVVMPFGMKPINDGSGRTYDFDKVYRVLIQRAIRNVSMHPLRADETEGSRVIHADMFKDLRDRPVVLVDLSLLNANVLYELGIRHVMSPTGTVLIANEETVKKLPFDIALSRTIPYRYDGQHMDWDEVERVVPLLQAAIEEAKRGTPDSPVYAFLEQVLSPHGLKKDEGSITGDRNSQFAELNDYQKQFAQIWQKQEGVNLDKLIDEHSNSTFGVRSIGYFGIHGKHDRDTLLKIAELQFNHEQHDLAKDLYKIAAKGGDLGFSDLLYQASATAYAEPNLDGASAGLKLIEKARALAKKKLEQDNNDSQALQEYSYATQSTASMLAWIWSLSKDDLDLGNAIVELRDAIRLIEDLRGRGIDVPSGRYAQNLLRYSMFLRISDNDKERYDSEGNFQKILSLKARSDEPYISTSYLHWYQVFILADMGKYDDAQKRATEAITNDIRYANKMETSEVGRRQYTELRRFLENFSRYWRDTKSIARISQILNSAYVS